MIAEPSAQSLFVVAMANGRELGSGTGFVVTHDDQSYLITNYHVAAGRDPRTGQPRHVSGAVPETLRIVHLLPPKPDRLDWEGRDEKVLTDSGDALWLEHPTFGRRVDVVALALRNVQDVDLHPYDLSGAAPAMAFGPATDVNVVGFQFGMTAGGAFGIWTHGFVASEPDIDFDDLPLFLVDARTREGQSGSPVIAYSTGGATPMADGSTAVMGPGLVNLLGVYSGRVNKDSDLGLAWKVQAVRDIVTAQHLGRSGL
jgi:hypothetical protein